jgi:hypothetical protein
VPADLVVDAIVLPRTVTAPCPTPVQVVVRNAGADPAPYPFEVCLQIAAGAEEPFFPEFVRRVGRAGEGSGSLAPARTVKVDFDVNFPCRRQNWVKAEADCQSAVPDNLRTDPDMAVFVPAVVSVPWLFTEVRIGLQHSSGAITWDAPQLCADLSLAVQVSVANRGCGDAPVSTTGLTVTGNAGQLASVSWPTAEILPGKTATFLHVLQFPSPPPTQVRVEACADTGGVVTDQCDSSGLCRSAVLPVIPGSGSRLLSLSVDRPVRPGVSPVVTWSVANDCSDLGAITAAVFFGNDKLYESGSIPIAPLGKAGEERVRTSVPVSAAAAGIWTVGQHPLELRVTSPGAPGQTFKSTAELQVIPLPTPSRWAWGPPPAASWHKVYGVAGTLTITTTQTAMTVSAITITEATATPGVPAAGAMPISAPSSPLQPGASTALGQFPLFQTWTWIDPWTFALSGPTGVTFTYVANFTLTDEFGNVYPQTSPTLAVIVRVPADKMSLGINATAFMQTFAVTMVAAAVAAAAGAFIAAAVLAAAAFALWGLAIWHKAMADDPPVPDFRYDERVEVRPVSHEVRREDGPAWADSVATVIDLLERTRAAHEALARIHAKLLGAHVDGDTEALRMQADDYRAALGWLQAASAEVPDAIALAVEELETDERLSPERVEAAVEAWRSGDTVDAGRKVWQDNGLPDEAFEDFLERMPHFGALPPLGRALARIAEQTVALASTLGEEGTEVLELADRS